MSRSFRKEASAVTLIPTAATLHKSFEGRFFSGFAADRRLKIRHFPLLRVNLPDPLTKAELAAINEIPDRA